MESSPIVQLSEARASGMIRYFTGKPCKYGHVCERVVSTRTCIDCKNGRESKRKPRVFSQEQRAAANKRQAILNKLFPERQRAYQQKYKSTRRWQLNQKSIARVKQRRIEDPFFALTTRIRGLVNQSLRIRNLSKKSKTFEIVGCTPDELRIHIERQFLPGMTWENRSRWHIDHIVPLATAKTEAEVIALNHFTNLRPLWAVDNLKKGSKVEYLL